MLVILNGIKYSFWVVLPLFLIFAIAQYFWVVADEFNSSGLTYFIYSTPIQFVALVVLAKLRNHGFREVVIFMLLLSLLIILSSFGISMIYLGFGGRW